MYLSLWFFDSFYGLHHFLAHLGVRDETFFVVPVVGEVAKVYQDGEDIVFGVNLVHVIGKTCCIHMTSSPCQHVDYVILQAFDVHVDIVSHLVV